MSNGFEAILYIPGCERNKEQILSLKLIHAYRRDKELQ